MSSEIRHIPLQDIRPEKGETLSRIKEHLALARDDLHRREVCLTWDGYIAALIEWRLISIEEHAEAYGLLKGSLKEDDPAKVIFIGV